MLIVPRVIVPWTKKRCKCGSRESLFGNVNDVRYILPLEEILEMLRVLREEVERNSERGLLDLNDTQRGVSSVYGMPNERT
jgi:hypothetical protein